MILGVRRLPNIVVLLEHLARADPRRFRLQRDHLGFRRGVIVQHALRFFGVPHHAMAIGVAPDANLLAQDRHNRDMQSRPLVLFQDLRAGDLVLNNLEAIAPLRAATHLLNLRNISFNSFFRLVLNGIRQIINSAIRSHHKQPLDRLLDPVFRNTNEIVTVPVIERLAFLDLESFIARVRPLLLEL